MFTLIMSVIFNGRLVVTSISGFETLEACTYAGAKQEVELRNQFSIYTDKRYTYVCVNMKEPK